jgi:hypothetical protein
MMGIKWDWGVAGAIIIMAGTVIMGLAALLLMPVFLKLGMGVTFIGFNIYVLESAGLIPRSCAGEV